MGEQVFLGVCVGKGEGIKISEFGRSREEKLKTFFLAAANCQNVDLGTNKKNVGKQQPNRFFGPLKAIIYATLYCTYTEDGYSRLGVIIG